MLSLELTGAVTVSIRKPDSCGLSCFDEKFLFNNSDQKNKCLAIVS